MHKFGDLLALLLVDRAKHATREVARRSSDVRNDCVERSGLEARVGEHLLEHRASIASGSRSPD
jgi:hypothetical protein